MTLVTKPILEVYSTARLELVGVSLRFDWRTSEAVADLEPNDLVIAFALRRTSKPLEQLLKQGFDVYKNSK